MNQSIENSERMTLGTAGAVPLGVDTIPTRLPRADCISWIVSPASSSITLWQITTAVEPAEMDCSVFEFSTSLPFCASRA